MATMCEARQGGGGIKWVFVLVALVAAVTIWLTMEHALRRHGSLAETIVSHCEMNPQVTMRRKLDMHKAIGCEYAPGKWGVTIKDPKGEVVTAFPNKSKTLDGIIRYLLNRGYQ